MYAQILCILISIVFIQSQSSLICVQPLFHIVCVFPRCSSVARVLLKGSRRDSSGRVDRHFSESLRPRRLVLPRLCGTVLCQYRILKEKRYYAVCQCVCNSRLLGVRNAGVLRCGRPSCHVGHRSAMAGRVRSCGDIVKCGMAGECSPQDVRPARQVKSSLFIYIIVCVLVKSACFVTVLSFRGCFTRSCGLCFS